MASGISNYDVPDYSHDIYEVHFYSDDIHTVVTDDPGIVANWISEIKQIHDRRLTHLVVGLDVEWRPSFNRFHQNPVATLQLCVGRRCLVFQILQYAANFDTNQIPSELAAFLSDEDYTFVGVGIHGDVRKLEDDYGVQVGGKIVDLRELAAQRYQMDGLRTAGLKELASVVLMRDVEKPRRITLGRWDLRLLSPDQVMYACIDAYVSFEIGCRLNASRW